MASVNVSWRFLAGARNDMAIRWLWRAEVAIRVTYHLSQQFTFESPLLPPTVLLKSIVIPSHYTNLHTKYYDNYTSIR